MDRLTGIADSLCKILLNKVVDKIAPALGFLRLFDLVTHTAISFLFLQLLQAYPQPAQGFFLTQYCQNLHCTAGRDLLASRRDSDRPK